MNTSGMLDKKLYVALSRLLDGHSKAELGAHMADHLAFMIGLEEAGTLFASGPFVSGDAPTGAGLTILRAGSKEEAAAILAKDPFVVAGIRTFDIHEWLLKEGSIQLTLHASKQRGMLP